MGQGQPTSEAEERARIRSYLVGQAAKRTPEQLVETLREAQRQFLAALAAIPDDAYRTPPAPGEWSVAEVLEHVRQMAAIEAGSIAAVLARGEPPTGIAAPPPPPDADRAALLAAIADSRERLIATALAADPSAHLDITWAHPMFGPLNWREWLLFARVHLLDHARQLQALAERPVTG